MNFSLNLESTPENFKDDFDYYLILKAYKNTENQIDLPKFHDNFKDLSIDQKISFLKKNIDEINVNSLVSKLIKSELESGITRFVKILKGESERHGSAHNLEEIKLKVAQIILPHLEKANKIEKEDYLTTLAIEGVYCTDGVKVTLNEIITAISTSESVDSEYSESLKYQQTVLTDLHVKINNIYDTFYTFLKPYLGQQTDDIHVYNTFKYFLAGDILTCDKPKNSDDFINAINKLSFAYLYKFNYILAHNYKNELIDYIDKSMKNNHFNPLNDLISNHAKFSEEQKTELKSIIEEKVGEANEEDLYNIKILYLSMLNIINPTL